MSSSGKHFTQHIQHGGGSGDIQFAQSRHQACRAPLFIVAVLRSTLAGQPPRRSPRRSGLWE